jgi:hypothetical protein
MSTGAARRRALGAAGVLTVMGMAFLLLPIGLVRKHKKAAARETVMAVEDSSTAS